MLGLGGGREFSARQMFGALVGFAGHRFEIPDDADPGQEFQDVICNVDLPPVKSLSGAAHVLVVVIVPSFAQGNQREEKVIAAFVAGFVPFVAE